MRFRFRGGVASKNPNEILAEREGGYEVDTNTFKIGDGVKSWSQLKRFLTELDLPSLATKDGSVSLNPAVEGLGYYVYGASYEGSDINNYSANTRYPYRIARRMGLIQVNRAYGGDESTDMFFHLSELNSTRRFPPGTKGIVHISGALNDALRTGTAQYRKETFKNNLKACIYRAFCQSIVEATDASVTYSAGWVSGSNVIAAPFSANLNYKSTNTPDATADVNLVGSDLCVFTYDLCTPSYAAPSARLVVTEGATTLADRTPIFSFRTAASSGFTIGGAVIPLVNRGAGTHAIRVTAKATASIGAFIQSFGVIDRTALPQVMINKFMYLNAANPPTGYTQAIADLYRTYVDEVLAEVISEIPEAAAAITLVDPNTFPEWNPLTQLGSDKLHPTDEGEAALANGWCRKMMTLPFRKGMNK